MAVSAVGPLSVKQNNICKEEPNEQLVVGLIGRGLLSSAPDLAPLFRKRRHEIIANQKNDLSEDDDLYEELLTSPDEKKRRLTVEQVNYLEMSFNVDLKLEPERKALIAKRLGLRPRQVAIWFQNRRARWKNKRLEQDYEALKASYNALVQENETLVKRNESIDEENKWLQEKVVQLTSMLRSHEIPCHVDPRGVSIILDSESDTENAMELSEQLRCKFELVSPTNLDGQSELLQDTSGLAHSACGEAIVALIDETFQKCSSMVACAAFQFEGDRRLFSPSEDTVINTPQSVNGFNVDDLLFSYEDYFCAFR